MPPRCEPVHNRLGRNSVVHCGSRVECTSGWSPCAATDATPCGRQSHTKVGSSHPLPCDALLRPPQQAPRKVERAIANGAIPGAAGQDPYSFVVVPQTTEIQAAEDALDLALVAMVVGTRPHIRAATIYEALCSRFNIHHDDVDIRGHEPDDFIVRFRRGEDQDRVLASWAWSRQTNGVLDEFSHRVVVALQGVPAHARNVAVAQLRLGTYCCEVEISSVRDRPIDDDREFFIQAWCKDPSLILSEDIIFIAELLLLGVVDPGVRRGLWYQVSARIVEQ